MGWRKCPLCGLKKCGFWENEYQLGCADCRKKECEEAERVRLRKAVDEGLINIEDLTPLGREVCGLPRKE